MPCLDKLSHWEAVALKEKLVVFRTSCRRAGLGWHQGFNRSLPLVAFMRSDEAPEINSPPGYSRIVKMLPLTHAIK